MRTFAELLAEYMTRTGVSDAELARTLGVRRQTIFRWKEGLVGRPRHEEDVLRCAAKLRLAPEERDALLIAAGFPRQGPPVVAGPVPPDGLMATTATERVAMAEVIEAVPVGARQRSRVVRIAAAGAAILVVLGLLALVWSRRLGYPHAGEGETLVVVAPFTNYTGGAQGYNVAGRLQAALAREMGAERLAGGRAAMWPAELRDEAAAQDAARRSGAQLVIWGEYDSGRVLARFTAPVPGPVPGQGQLEMLAATPAELSATINGALPEEIRYLALATLGQLYADREEYDRARAIVTQALSRPPADSAAQARLHFLLGYVAQRGHPSDLDGAIESYSQALALRPELISAHNNRGVAYLQRGGPGDAARAVEDLTPVIEATPGDAVAYSNRGAAYLNLATPGNNAPGLDVEEALTHAIADLDRAVELDPEAPQAYFNRGLAYIRRGERLRWQADLERVLALNADHAGALNALCWGYALDREPELALPYCERAVALDPEGPSRDSRGIVYAELGRTQEAIADFEVYLASLRSRAENDYKKYGPRREAWLDALRAGENPFGRTTLEQLRGE